VYGYIAAGQFIIGEPLREISLASQLADATMQYTITFNHLNLQGTLKVLPSLCLPPGTTEVKLDFAGMTHVEPFGLLLMSRALSMLKNEHRDIPFVPVNYEHCTYAGHFGFFQSFGCNFGKKAGQAYGNENYFPITVSSVRDLVDEASGRGSRVGDFIKAEAIGLSRVLARSNDGPLFEALSYSIREIMRNVVEHSHALSYEYCAQFWPNKNRVEVAIMDRGIGIRKSLSSNPYLTIKDNHDALNWSLLPGISGKTFAGIWIDKSNPYQNSGYGLFLTSRICKLGGSFFIGSSDSAIELNDKFKKPLPFNFKGTAIRMVLSTQQLLKLNLESQIQQFLEEGEKIIDVLPQAIKVPNSASKLLRGDFSIGTG